MAIIGATSTGQLIYVIEMIQLLVRRPWVDPEYTIPAFLKEAVATGFIRPARATELRVACSA